MLAAADCFTTEVWTRRGLITYYVPVFFRVAPRRLCVAGITPYPADYKSAMQQIQNLPYAFWAPPRA